MSHRYSKKQENPLSTKPLEIWTIYYNTVDYPDSYVARMFLNDKPTDSTIIGNNLTELRDLMQGLGLFNIGRQPGDDPVIVESWI